MNYAKLEKDIVSWLKYKVKSAGVKGIVLGLSGGIDSAVVSVLCSKAVGMNRLLCLLMPCNSHKTDFADANSVAKKFKLKTRIIKLDGICTGFMKVLPAGSRMALANIKPRMRMITLYYFANAYNYLVAGTGNKSELVAGYFTKYGDGGVDLLPIADILKKDVRGLARHLGIPEKIITKAPSAGLWYGQTDEGEMGITYDELDEIIEKMDKKEAKSLDKKKVLKVRQMFERSSHKRCLPEIFKTDSY